MPLTDRERKVLQQIREWERNLDDYHANDFQLTYEKYLEKSFSLLPDTIQKQFFSVIDGWLFYLNSMIQGSQLQMDAKERILSSGRAFRQDIERIEDLKKLEIDQLKYISEQQMARHRFYSFVQGAMAGTGGTLMLGTDLPAIAVINLRVVQLIAMTYGYEVNTPFEMMASLKVFHTGTLPLRMQKGGWALLMEELNQENKYFYEGKEEITDITWLDQPIKQIVKAMLISVFRKKLFQGVPLVSLAIGAGANYRLTRNVTTVAHNYYQLRFLREKEEISR